MRLRPNGQVVAKKSRRTSNRCLNPTVGDVFKRLRAGPIKRGAVAINRDGAGVPLINVVGRNLPTLVETGAGLSGNNSL